MKQWRQLKTSTTHLALELLTKVQCNGGSKLCKRDKSLEDEACSGWPLEGDNDHWRAIVKGDPLTTPWEAAEEPNADHPMVTQHVKQIGNVKKLDKWMPHELTKNEKKKMSFWSVVFSYSIQQQWTISWLDCDVWWKVDFIWQMAVTSSVAGWEKKLQSTSQSQTRIQKRSWSLFGVLLLIWSTIASWIWVKPLHVRSYAQQTEGMHRKLKPTLAHRTAWFSSAVLNHMAHSQRFQSWTNWAVNFCLIHHIHLTSRQPAATSSSI